MKNLSHTKSRWIILPRLFFILFVLIVACKNSTNSYSIAPIENLGFLFERYQDNYPNKLDTSYKDYLIQRKNGRYVKTLQPEKLLNWIIENRKEFLLDENLFPAIYTSDDTSLVIIYNKNKLAYLNSFGEKGLDNEGSITYNLSKPEIFSSYQAQFIEQPIFVFSNKNKAIVSPENWKVSESKETLILQLK